MPNVLNRFLAVLMAVLILALGATMVWGAATKDGKPAKKASPTPAPTQQTNSREKLKDFQFMKELKKQAGINWISLEESRAALEKAKQMESETKSVYDAAAEVLNVEPFFNPAGVTAETASVNFDTGGKSYYDINANDRNPRQIAIVPGSRNVAVAWAKSPTNTLTARNMYGSLWVNASKSLGFTVFDTPQNQFFTGRGGFGGVTYLPKSGKLVLYSHHAQDPRGTFFAFELSPGSFDWEQEYRAPHKVPGGGVAGQWPTAAGGLLVDAADYDGDANTTETLDVIHFFVNSDAGGFYGYSRAVIVDTPIFPGFTGENATKVDSGSHIVPTVVASKKSTKVALVYTAEHQCGGSKPCSDVYYIESTNGGQNWVTAGSFAGFPPTNITNYSATAQVRAHGDIMGVYNQGDSLIISYLQLVDYDYNSGATSSEADIYVWSAANGPRKAVDGNFVMPGVSLPGAFADQRRLTVNWPHLAVHNGTNDVVNDPDRKNYLYLVYTQFGGNDSASYTDIASSGDLNGELYVAVSTNSGKTWGAGKNVTKSKTPGCISPNCSDVTFASCAELCDDTIHIMYMSDLFTQNTGGSGSPQNTDNPVIYMKVPAFDPIANKAISVTPSNLILDPGATLNAAKTDTFHVQNIGNTDLTVDSIVEGAGSPWLTINNGAGGFPIPEGAPDSAIGITVNDATLAEGVYRDSILIHNNSTNNPVLKVYIFLVVDAVDNYVSTDFGNLSSGVAADSVTISVSNVSNIANTGAKTGFYRIVGGDTTNNLYDASKFVAVVTKAPDNDTVAGRFLFGQVHMQPLSVLYLDNDTVLPGDKVLNTLGGTVKIPRLDTAGAVIHYSHAKTNYCPIFIGALGLPFPGPWFGLNIYEEWWLRHGFPRGLYWVQCITRSSAPSWWDTDTLAYNPATTNVYIGKAMDWDVEEDDEGATSPVDNYGRTVPGTGLIWMQGSKPSPAGYAVDSALFPNGHFGYVAFLGDGASIDPFAMHVASNSYAVFPTNGYDDPVLYKMAADSAVDTADFYTGPGQRGKQYKYFLSDTIQHDSIPDDLNAVMTDVRLLPSSPDTVYVVNVLGVVAPADSSGKGGGCNGLARIYNKIRQESGLTQIADLQNKLRCGAACVAKPGDANASNSYSLGDVISTVNYIFNKPGCTPQPLCWLSGLICRGDWNGSNTVTLGDVIQAVNFIFNKPGGPWTAKCVGTCCTPVCL